MSGHFGRLFQPHQAQQRGSDIRQNAIGESYLILVVRHVNEIHKVGRVGCIRRTILIAHVFGIAMIRRNKQLAAKFQHLLHTFFQGAVHCFAGGDAGFHKSGMANHVPIGEIHDYHIILVHSVHKFIRHFRRAHLGLQVISSHFPGGRNKDAVFSGELGLHTSVKEESNVGVLFRFRYAELGFPGFRHNLPENIVQLFLFKNNGRGILGIVFRQRHIVHFGRYFTVKSVKFGVKESVAHLPGAVRTEIKEEHHIVVPHALFVAIGKNAGLQELIRLPLRITLLHIFGRGAGALFAAPQNDGIPCQLVAVPALIPVHRIETADNRGNFGAVRPDGFLQLANKAGPAGWRAVTAVRNGMDANIADTRFISIFDDADQMVDMAVHAAVTHQAKQVQTGRSGLGKSGLQHGVFPHGPIFDGIIHPAEVLKDNAARTQVQVSYFGITHLAVRKAHVLPGSAQQAVGIVGKEVISKGGISQNSGVTVLFRDIRPQRIAAPAVANNKNVRLFRRHRLYLQASPPFEKPEIRHSLSDSGIA